MSDAMSPMPTRLLDVGQAQLARPLDGLVTSSALSAVRYSRLQIVEMRFMLSPIELDRAYSAR